ncbi:MAG: hypothetical protein QW228_05345 [Candidatus Aenigmatarchaeota archaeon]
MNLILTIKTNRMLKEATIASSLPHTSLGESSAKIFGWSFKVLLHKH